MPGFRLLIPFLCVTLSVLISAALATGANPTLLREKRALRNVLNLLHARRLTTQLVTNSDGTHEIIFTGASDNQSRWKAEVAAGVIAADGFPVNWVSVPGSGSLHLPAKRVHVTPAQKAPLERAIKAAIKTSPGARIENIEFLRPLAFAPIITIRWPRFQEPGTINLESILSYHNAQVEGVFLIVRDARGHIRSQGGIVARLGTGTGTWPGAPHG